MKYTVVTYCAEKHKEWISHWIQQLNQQSFKDFKVLFIAHNWTPKGGEFKDLQNPNVKVTTYFSEPLIGKVINEALKIVDTEYFVHWDVDDLFHPRRLEIQTKFLEEHFEIDFLNARAIGFEGQPLVDCFSDLYKHDKSSPLLQYLTDPNLNTSEQIKECFNKQFNCLAHGLMIYKTQVMKKLGGFSLSDVKTDGKSPDWESWKKAINAGYKFYRLPELLMIWNLGSSAIRI